MKKIICSAAIFFSTLIFCGKNVFCQGLYNTASLIVNGNAYLIIKDGGFNNNGTFMPGAGTVIISGAAAAGISTIGGSSLTPFNHLTINKTLNEAILAGNISVDGNLNMQAGNLELNLFNIELGSGNGAIMNENGNARITGTNGGNITKSVVLNAPISANPGNIGIAISSANNLGNTVIKRVHQQQTSAGGGLSIDRYFDISPSNNTSLNATLQMFYFDGELAGIHKSELNFYKSEDAGSTWKLIGEDNSDTVNDWVLKNNIDQLSRWTLASNIDNPLPVKLISFTAALVNKQAKLQWVTENEINSSYYEVQRSANGINFIKLLSAPATGNNNPQSTYHAIDPNPFNGITYYRLKEVDVNGAFSFSPVEHVTLNSETGWVAFPNPASGIFYVNINVAVGQQIAIALCSASGKLMQERYVQLSAGSNQISWDMSSFAKGVYYLQSTGLKLPPIKIVKQ